MIFIIYFNMDFMNLSNFSRLSFYMVVYVLCITQVNRLFENFVQSLPHCLIQL